MGWSLVAKNSTKECGVKKHLSHNLSVKNKCRKPDAQWRLRACASVDVEMCTECGTGTEAEGRWVSLWQQESGVGLGEFKFTALLSCARRWQGLRKLTYSTLIPPFHGGASAGFLSPPASYLPPPTPDSLSPCSVPLLGEPHKQAPWSRAFSRVWPIV